MRITGGILKGRSIPVPQKGIRPTQDKVRAAVFSALAARVPGARVLDLFAGTGALGLEAWSRGASLVCWVEGDRRILRMLKENVSKFCSPQGTGITHCRLADVFVFLKKGWTDRPFDIILADPPYELEAKYGWLEKTLQVLEEHSILASDGVLVFEQGLSGAVVERAGWSLIREKKYGETRVLMYMRASSEI